MQNYSSSCLLACTALLFSASAVGSETYHCKQSATVSIDQYEIESPAEDARILAEQDWIVDVNRGWRRSDFPHFNGACGTNNGYVVCRADSLAFGEATLSIHPDGSNFLVVYMDYGLGALAVVGKCRKET